MNTDTSKRIWFRVKRFGLGWYPVSWEGWIVTMLYVLAIVPMAISINRNEHSASDFLINFAPNFIIVTIFLLIICYITGERPRWSWGKKIS